MNSSRIALIASLALAGSLTSTRCPAQIARFHPPVGEALEVWRITDSPAVCDYHNYHNTQCWSPDGRYVAFTHYAGGEGDGGERAAEIHLFDTETQADRLIERGVNPRWANSHPWLLYNRLRPADGPANGRGTQVVKYDVTTSETVIVGYGLGRPTMVSFDDAYLYGIWYPAGSHSGDAWQPYPAEPRAARIALRPGSELEFLPGTWGVGYNSILVNPTHPVIVSRDHHFRTNYFATPGTLDVPFKARHFVDTGLAGEHPTPPFPTMDGAHFAWSGDGEYFLPANGPVRGRKWNEPFPANIHFLANIAVGDIGPAGRSGRWLVGSTGGGDGSIRIADLRSGEGRVVMPSHSFLCFPSTGDNSGPYDNDAKGSPDGTKVAFVSTYDLEHGPAAGIVDGSTANEIRVDSTAGFPASGELVNPSGFGGEVIRYQSKTPTSFRGLTRGLYGTNAGARLRTDRMLMLLDSLLIPPDQRRTPTSDMRHVIKDPSSPLLWQRATDVYVAVVRRPDRPWLRLRDANVELVPGENHWETRAYRITRTDAAGAPVFVRAGEKVPLSPGEYTAAAAEWSGLESPPSATLRVSRATTLVVLADAPADFSWTSERWTAITGAPLAPAEARHTAEAVCETVHRYDGVIRRQHWREGELVQQDDLNAQGRTIRRLSYEQHRLAKREYFDGEDRLVSTELFDADGFITYSAGQRTYPDGQPAWKRDGATTFAEWYYDHAVPVRYRRGTKEFVKEENRWVPRDAERPAPPAS